MALSDPIQRLKDSERNIASARADLSAELSQLREQVQQRDPQLDAQNTNLKAQVADAQRRAREAADILAEAEREEDLNQLRRDIRRAREALGVQPG